MISLYQFKNFKTIPSCRHTITTKAHYEPYSCSMALHTGEDTTDIIENRKKIICQLEWDKELSFITANQTHSDHIQIITKREDRGWYMRENAVEDCDALITNKKNIMLTICTADCVPVLLMDVKKDVIAAVHAGWRGTKSEIVAKTVKKMCDVFHCDPHNIIAGIGPAIGACCYEVDINVARYFPQTHRVPSVNKDKFMLDLSAVNKEQLLGVGLLENHIEMSELCTSCKVDRFFSYRKEKACSGRFMSMIGLN